MTLGLGKSSLSFSVPLGLGSAELRPSSLLALILGPGLWARAQARSTSSFNQLEIVTDQAKLLHHSNPTQEKWLCSHDGATRAWTVQGSGSEARPNTFPIGQIHSLYGSFSSLKSFLIFQIKIYEHWISIS